MMRGGGVQLWDDMRNENATFQMSHVVPLWGRSRMRENRVAVARRGRGSLAQLSPKMSVIRGTDGGAAHCCYEHEGPTLSIPVRFLRATASM